MAQPFSQQIMKTTHGHSDANGRNVFSAIIYRNFAVKSLGKMKRLARLDGHSARAAVRGTAGLEWTLDTGRWSLAGMAAWRHGRFRWPPGLLHTVGQTRRKRRQQSVEKENNNKTRPTNVKLIVAVSLKLGMWATLANSFIWPNFSPWT